MSEREPTGSGDRCQSDEGPALLAWEALRAMPDAVVLFDGVGGVSLANSAASELLGEAAQAGATRSAALRRSAPLADLVSQAWRSRNPRTAVDVPCDGRRLQAWVTPFDGGCLLILRESTGDPPDRHLWQAERMAALGRLAGSVAHEVRNPLGAVDIQLQLLARDAESLGEETADRVRERVGRARAEVRRLDGIVQNFLRFSRPPEVRLAPTDPALVVQRMHELVAPEARERGIRLRLKLPPQIPPVHADENMLSQALLNVLINAFQAVEEAGEDPLVELTLEEAQPAEVRIQVKDNGCGVSPEDLERVFEYYYTTKDSGTGLGLSIAQGILRQHGGSLHLTSRPQGGTTVSLLLPTSSSNPS